MLDRVKRTMIVVTAVSNAIVFSDWVVVYIRINWVINIIVIVAVVVDSIASFNWFLITVDIAASPIT